MTTPPLRRRIIVTSVKPGSKYGRERRARRGMTEAKESNLTFERDDDDFLLPISAPLLDLPERINKHARIHDDDVSLFDVRLLGVVGPAPPPSSRTLLLVMLVLLMRMCRCDPDTADGKLAALGIGRGLRV